MGILDAANSAVPGMLRLAGMRRADDLGLALRAGRSWSPTITPHEDWASVVMTMASDDHPNARRAGTRRLAPAVSAFAFSVVVAVVVPFLFIRLIASAQDACFDIEGGQAFFLMVTWFGLVIVGWWLFWVGALIAWRMRPVARMVAGVLFVLGVCFFATWQLVPWEPMSGYAMAGTGTCGPGGVPTWWPPFLPHR